MPHDFLKGTNFDLNPTSVSLAVADTISLVASVPQEVLSYHILSGQWVWGSVGCSLMVYLQVSYTELITYRLPTKNQLITKNLVF